ncbi:MAG: hypothetical protein RIS51_596, partial [Actinomycetota bacterium]
MKKILNGPFLWVTPMLVLIFTIVLWPVVEMVRTSLLDISSSGKEKGFAGLDNYVELLENPNL